MSHESSPHSLDNIPHDESAEAQSIRLLNLNNSIVDERSERALRMAHDPTTPAALEAQLGPDLLMAANATRDEALSIIREPTMRAIATEHQEKLDLITQALEEIPTAADGTEHTGRYLDVVPVEETGSFYCNTHFRAIEADIKNLEFLKTAYPEDADTYTALQMSLQTLMRNDPRNSQFQWQERQQSHFSDQVVGQAGKTSLIIIASAGALLTGISFLRGGKSPAALFLYAGVAALLASPSLRRSIFGNNADNVLKDTDSVLNNDAFKTMSSSYAIEGSAWRNLAENIMTQDQKTTEFLAALRKNTAAGMPEEDITAYVTEQMPATDPGAREGLTDMIHNGDYVHFADILSMAKKEGTQEVVADYIELGSHQYAKDKRTLEGASKTV